MIQTENRTAVIREKIENIYKYLHRHKEYINRLNVFPVPDGDTGLNMTLTIQGALANMQNYEKESISTGEYLKNFAEQMLLNSRGCSGVILSLYCQGIAQVIENNDFSNDNLLKAFENGYKNAYEGTEDPKEGTMLTLMREFKDKYGEIMKEEDDPSVIIKKCIPHLKEVLKKTPDMLLVLKQAGVVDSGGAGFLIILQGINRELKLNGIAVGSLPVSIILNINRATKKYLNGKFANFTKNSIEALLPNIDIAQVHNLRLHNIFEDVKHFINNLQRNGNNFLNKKAIINDLEDMKNSWNPEIKLKYCTEFILETNKISSKEQIKEIIGGYGDSLIILNSGDKYKVHIHTDKPESVFKDVSKYGELIFTKVDDMKKQHKNLISNDTIDYEREKSVFCLVSGKGFADILKNLGADDVFCYGKNKPSVERIVKELNRLKTKNIIVAADDKDILMALKYAASLSKSNVHIVESNNVISLISMVMNISKELDITTTLESVMNSLNDIRFCGIARAVRDTTTENGKKVNKKDFFTIYNGKIILSDKNLATLIINTIKKLVKDESLISIYKGIPAKKDQNLNLIPKLKKSFPDYEFEEYYGGQYQYNYYITFE
ncbi:DAK2 domain-containing protein [Anaerophaga thermohalophila]|uniref:DAK2 domain-containing protein n=1 Tax=Anaerophaga thermohalophila TaxID=177400 RepID=UPI0002E407B0|nr:DAK2 domain-containing protein [Anaerophaga thermohalophila]